MRFVWPEKTIYHPSLTTQTGNDDGGGIWPVPAPRLHPVGSVIRRRFVRSLLHHKHTWSVIERALSLHRTASVCLYCRIKLRQLTHQENVESLKYFSKIHHFLYQLRRLVVAAETKNSARKVLPQDFYQESVMFWKINLKYWIQIEWIMEATLGSSFTANRYWN